MYYEFLKYYTQYVNTSSCKRSNIIRKTGQNMSFSHLQSSLNFYSLSQKKTLIGTLCSFFSTYVCVCTCVSILHKWNHIYKFSSIVLFILNTVLSSRHMRLLDSFQHLNSISQCGCTKIYLKTMFALVRLQEKTDGTFKLG